MSNALAKRLVYGAALGAWLTLCAVAAPALGQSIAEAPAAPEAGSAEVPPAPEAGSAEAPPAPEASVADEAPGFELREAPERELTGKEALAVQAGGLTSDQVAKRALAASPALRGKQAEIDAASAKVDEAIAQLLPRLKLTAMYRRVSPVDASLGGAIVGTQTAGDIWVDSCPSGPELPDYPPGADCPLVNGTVPIGANTFDFPSLENHYSLNATLSVPISDYVLRLSDTLTATRSGQDAAEIQKRAEALKVASDARVAYYNWLRSKAAVAVAKSSLARFGAALENARIAFRFGTVTKADVLRLESAVASAELAVAETDTFQQLAEEQLATIMDEPVRRYQVGEDVLQRPDSDGKAVSDPPLEDLIGEAYKLRMELRGLQALSRSLRAGARAARVGQWPRLDAFGDFTYANPNLTIFPQREEWNESWALGVSLSYTLNDSLSGAASGSELEANLRKAEADLEALRRGIKLEVTSAYFDVRKARTAIETATRGYAAAKEAYRVSTDLYRVGRATTTDLIEAESELVAASLQEVNALLDWRIASVRLQHATGRDTTARR